MEKEILNNNYVIFSDGRIFSNISKKFLKPQINSSGYFIIKLLKKQYQFHRIIADAFIPNPNNYSDINHINGIKTDNRLQNLEWCNRRYNINHFHNRKFPGATFIKKRNVWKTSIRINNKRLLLGYFKTQKEASDVYLEYIKNHNL